MEDQQKSTSAPATTDTNADIAEHEKKRKLLAAQQEAYIAYCAVGGIITEEDGILAKKMTTKEFAEKLGVDRTTLYLWQKSVPDFWERVNEQRSQIFTGSRLTAVWNGLFLQAAKGNVEAAKVILGQYANWQPPAQKHELDVGTGLADLLQGVRKRKQIEAAQSKRVVIDADTSPTKDNA